MLKNKNHIIFDWNGTLVDDAWIFVDILNVLLESRGLKVINYNGYRQLFTMPIKIFYEKLGIDTSPKPFKEIEKEFIEEYIKRMFQPKLFNNTVSILIELINHGKTLSVLSASHKKILNQLISYYKIEKYFNSVVGVDNYTANGKLVMGVNLIKKSNFNLEETLLVGDTDADYMVAQQLNIDSILISGGHQSKKRLNKISDSVITSINDLILY